jgi:hypothetical protein
LLASSPRERDLVPLREREWWDEAEAESSLSLSLSLDRLLLLWRDRCLGSDFDEDEEEGLESCLRFLPPPPPVERGLVEDLVLDLLDS